jgi:hypothetical protein
MARGESGRIVIEVDPALKRELYAALAMSGSTLKDWFIRSAEGYCASGVQGSLFHDLPERSVAKPEARPDEVAAATMKKQLESAE